MEGFCKRKRELGNAGLSYQVTSSFSKVRMCARKTMLFDHSVDHSSHFLRAVKQALRDAYIPRWARKGLRVRIKDLIDFQRRDKTGVIVEESNEKEWILILDDGREVVKICKKCQKRCISTSGQQEQVPVLPRCLIPSYCRLCFEGGGILSFSCSESD